MCLLLVSAVSYKLQLLTSIHTQLSLQFIILLSKKILRKTVLCHSIATPGVTIYKLKRCSRRGDPFPLFYVGGGQTTTDHYVKA